jgi:hypothetical protein
MRQFWDYVWERTFLIFLVFVVGLIIVMASIFASIGI